MFCTSRHLKQTKQVKKHLCLYSVISNMNENMDRLPPGKIKIFFWLILGFLSVFFAEVVSGSDMFPYFTPWGLLVVVPLYTLHILVLSYIIFRRGNSSLNSSSNLKSNLNLYTLFIAGAIFGMYEAYITKVLWSPTWGDPIISVGGIALIESIVLVLWWHPLMAFIIPLFVSENLLTASKETMNCLPKRFNQLFNSKKKYMLIPLFALLLGAIQSSNSLSPSHSILSGFSTTLLLMVLIYIWRNKTKGMEYTMRQLLPSKKEFIVLSVLLITFYIVTGLYLRPEALPGLMPQLIVWLAYAFLFGLLYLNLKRSRKIKIAAYNNVEIPILFSWKPLIIFSLIFSATSAIFAAAGIGMFVMLAMWLFGIVVGLRMLYLSVKDAVGII